MFQKLKSIYTKNKPLGVFCYILTIVFCLYFLPFVGVYYLIKYCIKLSQNKNKSIEGEVAENKVKNEWIGDYDPSKVTILKGKEITMTFDSNSRFEGEYIPKPPIKSIKDVQCPYCDVYLSKIPLAKTKCKSCGNYIYSVTGRDRQKKLLTYKQKDYITAEELILGNLQSEGKITDNIKSNTGNQWIEKNIDELGLRFLQKVKEDENYYTDNMLEDLYTMVYKVVEKDPNVSKYMVSLYKDWANQSKVNFEKKANSDIKFKVWKEDENNKNKGIGKYE
jgi:hypothetical protein